MNIWTILALVWIHFFADFTLQTDKMATNKSKKFEYLLLHAFVYCIPLIFFSFKFATINMVLHLAVDFFTSKLTTYFWSRDKRHWFFVTIGADQAIHLTLLLLTYYLMFGA